ncbi:hypothetical protein TNCV_1167861 [Trichonephila clavipes]|uniref:Uncharacterized protein n=1 Tax=Trichonephila clavipes TaxID=2585209 RepID=A0A8X6SYH3_TRICX|nr:hypothetical protein TNCV_1167861 [Trichonephila clavipes]
MLDTFPQDGSEFIHKSKLKELSSLPPYALSTSKKMMYWERIAAHCFEERAIKLQADKATLIQKFPLQIDLPGKDGKQMVQKVCAWVLNCIKFIKINLAVKR